MEYDVKRFLMILFPYKAIYIPFPKSSKLDRQRQKAWIGNSDKNKHQQASTKKQRDQSNLTK
jgi:hypothetical protein